jgi:hypothetical protein
VLLKVLALKLFRESKLTWDNLSKNPLIHVKPALIDGLRLKNFLKAAETELLGTFRQI